MQRQSSWHYFMTTDHRGWSCTTGVHRATDLALHDFRFYAPMMEQKNEIDKADVNRTFEVQSGA